MLLYASKIAVALAIVLALPRYCLSKEEGLRGNVNVESTNRRALEGNNIVLTKECTIFINDRIIQDRILKDFRTEESYDCQLDPLDADGVEGLTFEIKHGNSSLADINIESGITKIFAKNSIIFKGKIILGHEIEVRSNENSASSRRLRNLVSTGVKSLLVILVNTSDGKSVRFSPERISDSLFSNGVDGNGVDAISLKSQYAKCSDDKLQFEPATLSSNGATLVNNGVVSVTVDNLSTDDDGDIVRSAQSEVIRTVGFWGFFDYAMFCLPDEVDMGIGYAQINGWRSVLRDDWCTYVSLQMHEVGHNLGLAHSGEGTSQYGDRSGIMGASFEEDDTSFCFNNAKNWQLGWYTDRQISINPLEIGYWSGELVGVVDYASSSPTQYVVLKIETSSLDYDYYVGYNKMSGFNSQTKEAGNKVTIQTRERSSSSQSWMVAELSEGDAFAVTGLFKVEAKDINSAGADITVQGPNIVLLCDPMLNLITNNEVCDNTNEVCEATADLGANGKESCNAWCERSGLECVQAWNDGRSSCQKSSSIDCSKTGNSYSICRCEKASTPQTPAPTPNPTPSPTLPPVSPTPRPTKRPTRNPTPNPTRQPTIKPTTPPTPKPSPSPTLPPVSPTRNPTRNPTPNPIRQPTRNPTTPPTNAATGYLCDTMTNLNEVCVDTVEVCEATANLGANGQESCNSWCERSGLQCMQAWDDGLSDCQKANSISCEETGNSYSICRCERPNLCQPYLDRIWDNEVCSNTPSECEATADLAQNDNESCDEWCERHGLQCTRAWNDGAFCVRTSEINCSTDGKTRSICLCEP